MFSKLAGGWQGTQLVPNPPAHPLSKWLVKVINFTVIDWNVAQEEEKLRKPMPLWIENYVFSICCQIISTRACCVLGAEQTLCQGVTQKSQLQNLKWAPAPGEPLPPAVHIWLGGSSNKTWAHEGVESGHGKAQSWACWEPPWNGNAWGGTRLFMGQPPVPLALPHCCYCIPSCKVALIKIIHCSVRFVPYPGCILEDNIFSLSLHHWAYTSKGCTRGCHCDQNRGCGFELSSDVQSMYF